MNGSLYALDIQGIQSVPRIVSNGLLSGENLHKVLVNARFK